MLIRLLFLTAALCVRLNWIIMHSEPVFIYGSFLYESILRAQDRLIFMPTREVIYGKKFIDKSRNNRPFLW